MTHCSCSRRESVGMIGSRIYSVHIFLYMSTAPNQNDHFRVTIPLQQCIQRDTVVFAFAAPFQVRLNR